MPSKHHCPICGGYWMDIEAFERHGELHDAMRLRRLLETYPKYPNAHPALVTFAETLLEGAKRERIINRA